MSGSYYLPEGLAAPVPSPDGLDAAYWEGTRSEILRVQQCKSCGQWQWGPEWLCHKCRSFDVAWKEVSPTGIIYSWERPWHPVHPALKARGPYTVVLVALPQAGNVRMLGNLLGPDDQEVPIGAGVEAVFEHHNEAELPYTLVQWRLV